MLFIQSHNLDPYYNLAAEEFLLRNSQDEIFMMWRCLPVVVTGKHQNAYAEINYRYIRTNGIRVARRLTGGGTVFHDPGNVNFTFIRNGQQEALVDFNRYVEPVIAFLKTAGVDTHAGSKHEIMVGDRKVSGNAEHVYRNRVLHHGTLLFDADLDTLHKAIHHEGGTYTDKSVQSNRSTVMNLSAHLKPAIDTGRFSEALFDYMISIYKGRKITFDPDQDRRISELAAQKYSQWNWVYGWSPDYTYKNLWHRGKAAIDIDISVKRGIIFRSGVTGSLQGVLYDAINNLLTGTEHREEQIRNILETCSMQQVINAEELDDLVFAFF
jgi:lipoate---protein ligase